MQHAHHFGRYVLRRRIAAGGMGEVYVAEQTGVGDFRKPLALKVLLPGLEGDEKHVRLFLAEARIAGRLTHPNIVQVFDAGLIDGRYFLAMELVDGVTLSELITTAQRAGQKVGAEVISLVARQVLEALAYAHEFRDEAGAPLDVIHRDISPSNILVSKRGEVKLTDFGIAKVRGEESNTAPGEVRGKLAYIAPELFRGASASARSDLYAVGVTLYRLAALASPFAGVSDSDPVANIMRRELIPLVNLRPDLPPPLVAAIERAMATEPADRFVSAAAMLEAFPRGDLEARREGLVKLLATAPAPVPVTLHTAPFDIDTHTVVETSEPTTRAPRRRPTRLVAALATLVLVLGAGWVSTRPGAPPPSVAVQPPIVPPPPPPRALPELARPEPVVPPPETPSPPERAPVPVKKAVAKALNPPALLSIQARPWANVEINGKAVGQTPLSRYRVSTPVVVLRLTNPGFAPLERRLKVSAGEEYKVNEDLEAR